jgi:hypothetical protein
MTREGNCKYNFYWNPKYYSKVISLLNNQITVDNNSYISLLLGEIDCRVHIGKQVLLHNKNIDDVIMEVVDRYNQCLLDLKQRGYKILIFSVHPGSTFPPSENPSSPVVGDHIFRNKITQIFNECLMNKAKIHGYIFCNIYDKLMLDTDTPNMEYFMDYVHLRGSLVRSIYEEELVKILN